MKTTGQEKVRIPALCPAWFLQFKNGDCASAYEKFYFQGYLRSLEGQISFAPGLSRQEGTIMASTPTGLLEAFSLYKGGAW